jgi:hypothetical protein
MIEGDVRRRRAITLLKIAPNAERRVAHDDCGHSEADERNRVDHGREGKGRDDPRKRDRENERERYGLPAEEAEPVDGERRQRAERQSEDRREDRRDE